MTIVPVGENDATVRHIYVVILVNKCVIRELQYRVHLSCNRIGKIDVSVFIVASHSLDPQRLPIDPAETRNVVLTSLDGHLNPCSLTPPSVHYANPDIRIG